MLTEKEVALVAYLGMGFTPDEAVQILFPFEETEVVLTRIINKLTSLRDHPKVLKAWETLSEGN